MNHTPGPWSIREHSAGTSVQAEGRGLYGRAKRVARVACDRSAMFVGEPEANAHLISAAPDLLAACKAAADAMTTAHPNGLPVQMGTLCEEQDWHTALRNARAAIAKAEGRTP